MKCINKICKFFISTIYLQLKKFVLFRIDIYNAWVGGVRANSGFVWISNGKPIDSMWNKGYPTTNTVTDNCVIVITSYTCGLGNTDCNSKIGFICQKSSNTTHNQKKIK